MSLRSMNGGGTFLALYTTFVCREMPLALETALQYSAATAQIPLLDAGSGWYSPGVTETVLCSDRHELCCTHEVRGSATHDTAISCEGFAGCICHP